MKKEKDILKTVKKTLKELLKHLNVEAEFDVKVSKYVDNEKNKIEYIDIEIKGEDLGVLIGYLGRNLRAIQRILGMMINKEVKDVDKDAEYVRVVIDVAGYREGRKDHLEKYALQVKDEVLELGDEVDMPIMTAFERRVIHLTLSKYDEVKTESFGEGRERHVRVMPAGK